MSSSGGPLTEEGIAIFKLFPADIDYLSANNGRLLGAAGIVDAKDCAVVKEE